MVVTGDLFKRYKRAEDYPRSMLSRAVSIAMISSV